jgi:hypothetical protein
MAGVQVNAMYIEHPPDVHSSFRIDYALHLTAVTRSLGTGLQYLHVCMHERIHAHCRSTCRPIAGVAVACKQLQDLAVCWLAAVFQTEAAWSAQGWLS